MSVAWETDVTLHRVECSREARAQDYHAHVQLEQAFGDVLNILAPAKDDIICIGASYKSVPSRASLCVVRWHSTAWCVPWRVHRRGAGDGFLQFIRWASVRRLIILIDECLST
jgi:hypothetical protein